METKIKENFNQIKLRLIQFIDYKDISKRNFCLKIPIEPSHLGKSNLKSSLSGDILSKILLIYPELSADWLITGRGEMLISEPKNADNAQHVHGNIAKEIKVSATHGNITTSDDTTKHLFAIIEEKDRQINTLLEILNKKQ